MQVIVKLFSVGGIPASDGSIIPRHVIEEYLASEKYRDDIAKRKMLGSLTHRCRNWATQKTYDPSISKTVGKDDQLLTIGMSAPTHYISSLWINDSDGWVYAKVTILDEEGLDEEAVQNIRRLKGLLQQGVFCGVSAIILGYWNSNGGHDTLKKMVALKGLDWTVNPSWVDAGAVEIVDDEGNDIEMAEIERRFSQTKEELMVKTFSNLGELGMDITAPKTSKIDGCFTTLKGKEFSINVKPEVEEKRFSVATLKERVRYAKFSPRMRFRKLVIEYKQAVKAFGGPGKIDPETEKIMKSLFATDVLDVIKTIHPDVMAGKQINTMLGCSSLGRTIREAAQKLQLPYRYAMQEIQKTGKISPMRYKKIQDAYVDFIKALTDEVFGNVNEIPEDINEEDENAEN